jgi:predicted PurR-regulated permease PerM
MPRESELSIHAAPQRPDRAELASWLIAAVVLLATLRLHLLGALLAGLIVFELVHVLAPMMQRRLSDERAKLVAVWLLTALVVGLVTALILAAAAFLRSEAGSLPVLMKKMAEIVEGIRAGLPHAWVENLPGNPDQIRAAVAEWLRTHAGQLQTAGEKAGRAMAHVLIGLVVGALVALREARPMHAFRPLSRALAERAVRFGDAFRNVVFAQVRISALNTLFTALYLMVVLPLFGVHLPLAKTLIAVTFVAGLLPVVGNLISNTAIVVVSLSHSVGVAAASLAYLVIIHKLEYFLNARIVGTQIRAHAWELLIAMLVMEAAFGLAGLIAAPIYYAYLKSELAARGLV